MKDLLYNLCNLRKVEVAQFQVSEFLAICKSTDVHPSNGAYNNGKVTYDLPNPITDSEAKVIAGHHGLLGEYQYCRDTQGMSPFEALAEWDLL